MLIYTTCSQVRRNGYYSHFRLECGRVIEGSFIEVSLRPGSGASPRHSGVLFRRFPCPHTNLAGGVSWPSVLFSAPLCRLRISQ